jgi:c-di-GMP-binding flagellar brake protein YcgR
MSPRLSEFESDILKAACDSNEKITIKLRQGQDLHVYRSRFLALEKGVGAVVIDEPTAESPNALPLAKGESVEVFFEYRTFRYLFPTRIMEHFRFSLNNRNIYAFRIGLPTALHDGERREYFRVQVPVGQPVTVRFSIYHEGAKPVMSDLIENMTEEFEGGMIDISGGGFALRGSGHIELVKGDLISARFRIKPDLPEYEIWCEVCSKRLSQVEGEMIWGLVFLKEDRNPNLRGYRNVILRYVLERQREVLFK